MSYLKIRIAMPTIITKRIQEKWLRNSGWDAFGGLKAAYSAYYNTEATNEWSSGFDGCKPAEGYLPICGGRFIKRKETGDIFENDGNLGDKNNNNGSINTRTGDVGKPQLDKPTPGVAQGQSQEPVPSDEKGRRTDSMDDKKSGEGALVEGKMGEGRQPPSVTSWGISKGLDVLTIIDTESKEPNTIYLDNGTTTNPNTGEKINPQSFESRQTLVHELQHFIQGKERFAKGASISKGRERVASEIRRLGAQAEQIRRLLTTQNVPQYAAAPLRKDIRNIRYINFIWWKGKNQIRRTQKKYRCHRAGNCALWQIITGRGARPHRRRPKKCRSIHTLTRRRKNK